MRRRSPMRLGFAAAVIGGLAVAPANAASLSAAEFLNEFNLIVFGDAVLGQDIEGRAYIGGNVTGNSFQVNTQPGVSTPPKTSPDADHLVTSLSGSA